MAGFSFMAEKSFELDNSDETFLNTAMRVVTEKGFTYIYPHSGGDGSSCVYVENGCGSCLIGTILVSLGVPAEWFSATKQEGTTATVVLENLGFSTAIQVAARRAQSVQDQGGLWGEALSRMIKTYTEHVPTNNEESFNSSSEFSDEPPF